MIRAFVLFAVVFGLIFALIWAASFTGYFDKARVKRIARVVGVAAAAILLALAALTLMFGLEHTVF